MNSAATTDRADWSRVAAGDQAAFGRIFDRHADLVYKYVHRRVGSTDVAEDITSQVFLETWRQRRDISLLAGSLRPWLIGVARNLERRHWRTTARDQRATTRLGNRVDPIDPIDSLVHRLDDEAELARSRHRLGQLSHDHREVLLLRAWEGLSYEEIADVLDISVGTVRSRLARARQKLAGDLGTTPAVRASTSSPSSRSDSAPVEPSVERKT